MPRTPRVAPGGLVFHVLNRANGRLRLFKTPADYLAFEKLLGEAHDGLPTRILDWCLMPNHWHLVLWPRRDGELSAFMAWLTLTHAQRWKTAHNAVGHGHLYQGRFKSFIIEQDEHLATVLRYVQRNPLRAGLVQRVEDWRWGSAWARLNPERGPCRLLSDWPIDTPTNWLQWVNRPQTAAEVDAIRVSIKRDRPYGSGSWLRRMVKRLNLEHTIRPPGRQTGWRKKSARRSK
jgi:putative transposase